MVLQRWKVNNSVNYPRRSSTPTISPIHHASLVSNGFSFWQGMVNWSAGRNTQIELEKILNFGIKKKVKSVPRWFEMIITHLNLRSSIYIKLHHNLLAFPTAPLAFCSLDPWWPISGTFQCKLDSWLLSREDRLYHKPNQVQPWRSKNEIFQVSPILVLHWFFQSSYSAYLERKKTLPRGKKKNIKK